MDVCLSLEFALLLDFSIADVNVKHKVAHSDRQCDHLQRVDMLHQAVFRWEKVGIVPIHIVDRAIISWLYTTTKIQEEIVYQVKNKALIDTIMAMNACS